MSEVSPIYAERRELCHLDALWIADDSFNEVLAEISPFADLYILKHGFNGVVCTSVFESFAELVARLRACGLAGDAIEVFAVVDSARVLRAKIPDKEGLVPLEDDDFAS